MLNNKHVRIICGSANRPLGIAIARKLNVPLCNTEMKLFSDGEVFVQINENIRGANVFIIQPTNPPAENILELLMLIEASRRASAKNITAVIPYYGYSRSDRKEMPRVCIGAKLIADLLVSAGANRVITMDLHAAQIQGFFTIPVDHLYSSIIFNGFLKEIPTKNLVVVSPDVGSIKVARSFAKTMHANLAIIDKRRPVQNQAEVVNIIGEVDGCDVIIRDDMIDTAGTLAAAATALKANGCGKIFACTAHGVLSGEALEKIDNSPIEKVIISDSIDNSNRNLSDKFVILSCAETFAESIDRIETDASVSIMFRE
ncbi:MAG: ribose-phosphate pyrophosphokinase [candidate division Zixibacteria bacterium]|nr:ribose-phosphate pyrophosphokinase [candidate division Zixibacteria bacterium]